MCLTGQVACRWVFSEVIRLARIDLSVCIGWVTGQLDPQVCLVHKLVYRLCTCMQWETTPAVGVMTRCGCVGLLLYTRLSPGRVHFLALIRVCGGVLAGYLGV